MVHVEEHQLVQAVEHRMVLPVCRLHAVKQVGVVGPPHLNFEMLEFLLPFPSLVDSVTQQGQLEVVVG